MYLVVSQVGEKPEQSSPANTTPQTGQTGEPEAVPASGSAVIAYYFHGHKRCETCRTIEAYSKEAIHDGFSSELKKGQLLWRVVNVDEPENTHFMKDFQLTNKSVVLVKVEDGQNKQWEELNQVWILVRDKEEFVDYIQEETRAFLKKL